MLTVWNSVLQSTQPKNAEGWQHPEQPVQQLGLLHYARLSVRREL
jgi:hypothetical protein